MLLLLLSGCPAAPSTGEVSVLRFDCTNQCWVEGETLEVDAAAWSGYLSDEACDDVTVTFRYADGVCYTVSQMCYPTPWEDPAVDDGDCCEGADLGTATDARWCSEAVPAR
jgi:hypothetical protein